MDETNFFKVPDNIPISARKAYLDWLHYRALERQAWFEFEHAMMAEVAKADAKEEGKV